MLQWLGPDFSSRILYNDYRDGKYVCRVAGTLNTGTHESLVDATNFVKTMEQHQHRKIACLEEIAYLNNWITKDELMKVYDIMKKNQYGQYLKDVMDGKYQELL